MRLPVPSIHLSWSISHWLQGTKLLYNWKDGIWTSSLYYPSLSSPGWTSCAHNQAHSHPPAIPSSRIQPNAVQNHTTSVCAMPLLTEGHGWNGWMFPFFFLFVSGKFWGRCWGMCLLLGSVTFCIPIFKMHYSPIYSFHLCMFRFAFHNKHSV